jgi:hypothetical protein
LLVLAFILGIILTAILPAWGWLVTVGAALIFAGYKMMVD